MAKGAAVGGSTLTIIKGALKIMAWTKAQTSIAVGVGVLLAVGTATVAVEHLAKYQRNKAERKILNPPNPQTDAAIAQIEAKLTTAYNPLPSAMIAATKFSGRDKAYAINEDHVLGWNQPLDTIVDFAFPQPDHYHIRMIVETNLPKGRYDFNASLTGGAAAALQQELQKALGIVGRHAKRETDVLHLKLKNPDATGLTLSKHFAPTGSWKLPAGQILLYDQPLASQYPSAFQNILENYFRMPIIVDKTGLANRFDINLTWDEPDPKHHNLDGLKQALLDQLGLELVPSREPIEMLVVEKVK